MNSVDEREREEFHQRGLLGQGMMLGSNFLAGILVLGYAGYWLDEKFSWPSHLGLVGGLLLGLVYGFYEAWKVIVLFSKDATSEAPSETKANE